MPHIHYPDAVGAVFFGEAHLFPDGRDRDGVDPLVVPRPPDVVEVIIDAGTAGTLSFRFRGQAPDISPIVISPEQRNIVRNAQTGGVVFLHFLVQAPELRHFA